MIQLSSRLAFALFLTLVSSLMECGGAIAQIVPDNTLGAESSTIRPDTIKNTPSDVLEGGASRGSNLFHSFREFSIKEGRGAYFANSEVIRNIFTRVTGGKVSNILGTLGVLGNANLFLLNPNGIIFGPNARLDMRGAFIGSTADSLVFDNNFEFSASNPNAPPLLTVNIPIGLRFRERAADISSTANLVTPGDLTLKAENLNLSGSLVSGGDLTLEALDTLTIRDSVISPFLAVAGRNLLLQGDQSVDIYALSHPGSGIVSGKDLVLRSANAVSGDAHFWNGGSFRIDRLDGSLGGLMSLYDPIIRASGDVSLESYTGTSLHILAGGLVFIPGVVTITGVDDTGDSLAETVTLSDGSTIAIDGSLEPTVDIRAGTTAVGSPSFDTGVPTSVDIFIGGISFVPIGGNGGKVFVSNQYQPNTALQTLFGGVTVGAITTGDASGGGSVTIDARGGITLNGAVNVSAFDFSQSPDFPPDTFSPNTYLGNGGSITLLAQGNILSGSNFLAKGLLGGNIILSSTGDVFLDNGLEVNVRGGGGGSITINAQNISLLNASKLRAGIETGFGTPGAQAGDITVNATGTVAIKDGSFISNAILAQGIGNTGNITLNTGSLLMSNNGQINSTIFASGQGNAGVVRVSASDRTILDSSALSSLGQDSTVGHAGSIKINTSSLLLGNGSRMDVSNSGQGNAGNISIKANEVFVSDSDISSNIGSPDSLEAIGNVGTITIEADSISFNNGSEVQAGFFPGSQGEKGLISLQAINTLSLNEAYFFTNTEATAIGNSSDIVISGREVSLSNSQLDTSSSGEGDAGLITITSVDSISLAGSKIFANIQPGGIGNGGDVEITAVNSPVTLDNSDIFTNTSNNASKSGDIRIDANSLSLTNGSDLGGSSQGNQAGNITIITDESVTLDQDSDISAFTDGSALGSNISIETQKLSILNGSDISGSVQGNQKGGSLTINASDSVEVTGSAESIPGIPRGSSLSMATLGDGEAGDITINTRRLVVRDGAFVLTSALTDLGASGAGGSILINASDSVEVIGTTPDNLSVSTISSDTAGKGKAGDLTINTSRFVISEGARVSSFTVLGSSGAGGTIEINASESVEVSGTRPPINFFPTSLNTSSDGTGDAGDIRISTGKLIIRDGAEINAVTTNSGRGGNIDITASESATIAGTPSTNRIIRSQLTTQTIGSGNAGNITMTTPQLTISDRGQIDASTLETGDTGFININANQKIDLNNSRINIAVGQNASGSSQQITLNTPQLTLTNNAQISARTAGTGQAGNIFVLDARLVTLDNSTITTQIESTARPNILSLPSNITLNADTLTLTDCSRISASTTGAIAAGNVTVNGNIFDLSQGSRIETLTRSNSEAGDITLNSARQITITQADSGLFAQTEGQGTAGSIIINTPIFNIGEGAIVSAKTSNGGDGGNITVNAPTTVTLGHNSQLTVETSDAGKAGNITLTSDTITIGTNAQISATATETATNTEGGGSITLNTSNVNIAGQLGIFAETQGQAPAGTLTLNPDNSKPNLNIRFIDQGKISASTSASGQGGDIKISAPNTIDIRGNGAIATTTSGSGNAGTINLNTNQLTLAEGVTVTASTATGTGNAGNINLNATQINLQQATINAFTDGGGNAGSITVPNAQTINLDNSTISTEIQPSGITTEVSNITLTSSTLNLNNNSNITASTLGTGDAGDITLTNQQLNLNNNSNITARSTGTGNAGSISLPDTQNLSLNQSDISVSTSEKGDAGSITVPTAQTISLNQSSITASTSGEGNTGVITLTGTEKIELNNDSEISNAVEKKGVGNAREITLNTPQLSLENSNIFSSTNGQGNAGSITVPNAQTITLDNSTISTEIQKDGIAIEPSNITLISNTLNLNNSNITASTSGTGNAGQITITANTLTSNNGGNIQTNTSSSGQAGDITLNIGDNLSLTNSTIAASTDPNSTGKGGNITINPTNTVNLDQQARISVNSQGEGDGGNISLTAQNLRLNNRSSISATTASGEGGNITLNVSDTIRQRNDSPISAIAGGTGNGGNITVNTQFLIGSENSGIAANAFEGTGGNVTITAQGIFRDAESAITASSQLGVDGVVETNTPEVDPSQGLVDLPQNLVDPNSLISQNACRKGGQSEFTVRGRGGLPASPEQVRSSDEVVIGLVEATEQESTRVNSSVRTTRKIVPAQGWRRNEKGEVVLVADHTSNIRNQRQINSITNCEAR